MNFIRDYLLSVISASVIVAIVYSLLRNKTGANHIIKLISGIYLSVTLLSPIVKIQISDFSDYYFGISASADTIIAEGKNMALNETRNIIKENLEAYILDKATTFQLDVEVELTLDEAFPCAPNKILISGNSSPYAKKAMQDFLETEIGIPKEQQIWR